ncbi:MAG: hypothetical protein Q8930_09625 [Bacillota bacterium]|nr:hypothetical protein [Bacillota bacterium]
MINLEYRKFIQYSRLNLIKDQMRGDLIERFLIGIYRNGEQKEFSISFYIMNNRHVLRLEAEHAAWELLSASKDILKELSRISTEEGLEPKPEDIYFMLCHLGIEDGTEGLNNLDFSRHFM